LTVRAPFTRSKWKRIQREYDPLSREIHIWRKSFLREAVPPAARQEMKVVQGDVQSNVRSKTRRIGREKQKQIIIEQIRKK